MAKQIDVEKLANIEDRKDWERLLIMEQAFIFRRRVLGIKAGFFRKVMASTMTLDEQTEAGLKALHDYADFRQNASLQQQVEELQQQVKDNLEMASQALEELQSEGYQLDEEEGYLKYRQEKFLKEHAHELSIQESE